MKYTRVYKMGQIQCLPSDEGSGLKYGTIISRIYTFGLPSDEGSGLKCHKIIYLSNDWDVFPRMREVD